MARNFLSSNGFSLFCAVLNVVFALQAFSHHRIILGAICTAFACLCFSNYKRA
jgi:hypothetical protein